MKIDYKWLYVSSTISKELARLVGDLSGLVPNVVMQCQAEKYPLLQARLKNDQS